MKNMDHNRPLKILFLHATWHSSSEYHVHRLLAENADPSRLACYFIWQSSPQLAATSGELRAGSLERLFVHDFGRDMSVYPAPSRFRRAMMMMGRFPAAVRHLAGIIHTLQPDAIYTSQQYYEVGLAHWFGRLFGIPHIIHISYPVGPWLGANALRAIRKTPHLIACSHFVRESAIDHGVSPATIHTLHHGTNLHPYDNSDDAAGVRAEFGWEADAPLIISAARLDPGKGHKVLLDAFARVRAVLPAARLLVCGEGTTGSGYSQVIRQHAQALGIAGQVRFAGFRPDLPRLLAAADVFCLPTELDALPLVFLAAMAARLPVVGCDSGGVPEVVGHGLHGYLAKPGDDKALAAYLLEILRNPALAHQLGEAGRKHAQERFAPGQVAARWTALLQQLLLQSPSQSAVPAGVPLLGGRHK